VIAAEICALLAFAAVRNHDKVGMLIYTDTVEKFVPIKKGRSHVLRVIREILYHRSRHRGTSLKSALEFLQKAIRRQAVIFVISDFLDEGFEKPLKILGRKHDVIAIHLVDPRERSLPSCSLLEMEDLETGKCVLVDTRSRKFREHYAQTASKREEQINRLFRSCSVDKVEIATGGSYAEPIMKLFREREMRR
jgi:uncharacterized protein (DUF58 family)